MKFMNDYHKLEYHLTNDGDACQIMPGEPMRTIGVNGSTTAFFPYKWNQTSSRRRVRIPHGAVCLVGCKTKKDILSIFRIDT